MTDQEAFEAWYQRQIVGMQGIKIKHAYLAGLAKGRELEREECAKTAKEHQVSIYDPQGNEWQEWGYNVDVAETIRDRGGK